MAKLVEPPTQADGMYFTFEPRPDQPHRYDQQASCLTSRHTGVTIIVGGNGAGCLAPEQHVFDPVAGRSVAVSEIKSDFHVWSHDGERRVIAKARRPVCLGNAPLYKFTLSSGRTFRATLHHRVLGDDRSWFPLADTVAALGVRLECDWNPRVDGPVTHGPLGWRTTEDYLDGCSACCRRCGELLHRDVAGDQESAASHGGVRGSLPLARLGSGCSRLWSRSSPLSRIRFARAEHHGAVLSPWHESACSRPSVTADTLGEGGAASRVAILHCPACRQSLGMSCPGDTSLASLPAKGMYSPCSSSPVEVVSCRFLRFGSYWDFEVPSTSCYELAGVIHHNTTSLALMKAMRFVLQDQPPPRPMTPFWIISEGYPMVMDTCWGEKLYARGMLPACEVQWDKIDWFRPTQNWPFRVPLKPWPNADPRNNWVLEFKSYDQGRSKMQASSIGGFVFVEQCPFELIVEVNRGCRDYNFPGSKIAEFTPIDPALSAPLERMLETNSLPPDWAIYRCNTECAMEAGHVSKEWFNEFFSMVSPEMRETRMTGAFASYEGLIYPSFRRHIHVVDGLREQVAGMRVIRKRALDWGAGPDNPMACVWGAKDPLGRWLIYDEYESNDQEMTYTQHAEAIKDQHPWPDDELHRETYADPAAPGLARLFTAAGLPCSPAINSVYEGIESVRVAFAGRSDDDPYIMIDSRCVELIRELSGYRWEKPKRSGVNPKNARPVPLKKNDHLCVSEGTLVATPDGPVPIELLNVGDPVYTHLGVSRVLGVACTGESECVRVDTELGGRLECSLDHPLFQVGGALCAAIDALPGTMLWFHPEGRSPNQRPDMGIERSLWSGEGLSIARGQTPTTQTDTSRRFQGQGLVGSSPEGSCTTMCMKRSTEESRMGRMSTMSTETRSTIVQRTLSPSPGKITQGITSGSVNRLFGKDRLSGIDLKRAASGIESTGWLSVRPGSLLFSTAHIAESRSRPRKPWPVLDIAATPAGTARESLRAWTTKIASVSGVARCFRSIDTKRKRPVRGSVVADTVVGLSRIGMRRVWAVATEDGSVVEGGIVCSNCDALRYLIHTDLIAGRAASPEARKVVPRNQRRFVR